MVRLIGVCGSDACPSLQESTLRIAEEVGRLIAQRGGIVVCGGRGGVMEAVCRGAKGAGGLTIGILPDRKDEANAWVDVPLATGLGVRRNMVIVHAVDVVIALNGRWGTLNEISFAQIFGKPLVLVKGSGGCVDEVIGGKTLASCGCRFSIAGSAGEAVDQAFSWCENTR
jgi:uncharacterized protein (TIGR00725 family)